MRFTVVSHAGLYVEDQGISVLIDPWLIGSCYWRSWWNFPEPDPALRSSLKPDYIYLTHLHWDHFHGPSLRRFPRDTHLLVPQVHTHRMVTDLRDIGFSQISEIPHGRPFQLGPNLTLHSFQFGFTVDSAVVISNGQVTLFNSNDCKAFGRPLAQILARFPKIDFVFRSYSSASSIPYCIEGYPERYGDLRPPQDYMEEFTAFALGVGATYAIPFASNHCFLHRDTVPFNAFAVSPTRVEQVCNREAERRGLTTRCIVMPAGSTWDSEAGFKLAPFDYEHTDIHIAELAARHRLTLEHQYAREAQVRGSYTAFERYFEALLRSLPPWLPRLGTLTLLFRVQEGKGEQWWWLDLGQRRVEKLPEPRPAALTIAVPALVINDCTRKRMFSTWGPSKRLRVTLGEGRSWVDMRLFLSLLDAYENDYLPLWRHLSPRYLGIWLRRWREFWEAAHLLVTYKLRGRPFKVSEIYRRSVS
ncbi:MAG: MBL fold metallo-hydrolase [Gloeomargaritaceae cyanobacterium C42_A2020_066]|nr:MBL fold metallo-hydrolase [Gloeomargaritaceae cyanobacterium C42_A2020_066]